MKPTKKSIIISAGVAAIALSAVGGAVATHAASSTTTTGSIIDKLAQRFNLKTADVQQVFDQQHQVNQAAHLAKGKTMLDQAVKDGKLTQKQEDLIVAKQKEVTDFMATLKGKTDVERKTAMQTEMKSLSDWATANSIPVQYAHFGGPRGHFGHGGGMRMNDTEVNDSATDTVK